MYEVTTFHFHTHEFRTIMDGDRPLFVAKDVCSALELENVSKACQNLPEDEKAITKGYTLGGGQDLLCVTESGLYRLIFRSNKPEAEVFRTWVFSEVLPALRKTGSYSTSDGATGFNFNEGVLNQIIEMMSLMANTLVRLERLEKNAIETQRSTRFIDVSNVKNYVENMCHLKQGVFTTKDSLYNDYCAYCEQTAKHKDAKPNFFVKLYRAFSQVSQGRVVINGHRTPIVTGLYLEA